MAVRRIGMKAVLALLASAALAQAALAVSEREQQLIDRIKPVGEVCVEGDQACATQQATVSAAAAGPRSGDAVYGSACIACHGTGAAGAPKIGDADAWQARIAQGVDALVSNAISGIRGMPPRGTCMNCSDEEIRLAVEHMIQGL